MDRETHLRYLEYLDRHEYFGKTQRRLTREQFLLLDQEERMLTGLGESRDDEQEARWAEVTKVLFRD